MCMLWVYACFDDAMPFPKAETMEDKEFPSLLETKTEIGNLRCEKGVAFLRDMNFEVLPHQYLDHDQMVETW